MPLKPFKDCDCPCHHGRLLVHSEPGLTCRQLCRGYRGFCATTRTVRSGCCSDETRSKPADVSSLTIDSAPNRRSG